jgi:hypothetical protein
VFDHGRDQVVPQFDFTVPVPGILLALYDGYILERDGCDEAADNDMLIVTPVQCRRL